MIPFSLAARGVAGRGAGGRVSRRDDVDWLLTGGVTCVPHTDLTVTTGRQKHTFQQNRSHDAMAKKTWGGTRNC